MLGKYTVCSSYCKQLDSSARPDNIESNVNNIATDTERASEELTTAHTYQRKAGRRMLCLLLIFGVVLAIVLIAVSTTLCWSQFGI